MPKPERTSDDALRALIEQTLREAPDDHVARTDALFAALRPVAGAAAIQKRVVGVVLGAFREGFRSGQHAGRSARWSPDYWKQSSVAREFREPEGATAQSEHFSRYNF